jgi:transcriptional regulator with XRE-family HTH domain
MGHTNAQDALIYAEEAMIVEAQTAINTLMEDQQVSRAELARRLGVSDAWVTQMFSDAAKNLTPRTLGRVFRALGQDCRVSCDRLDALAREECAEIEKPMEAPLRPDEAGPLILENCFPRAGSSRAI